MRRFLIQKTHQGQATRPGAPWVRVAAKHARDASEIAAEHYLDRGIVFAGESFTIHVAIDHEGNKNEWGEPKFSTAFFVRIGERDSIHATA